MGKIDICEDFRHLHFYRPLSVKPFEIDWSLVIIIIEIWIWPRKLQQIFKTYQYQLKGMLASPYRLT